MSAPARWQKDELVAVPCDCCGGTAERDVATRPDGLRVVACQTCGLHFVSPRPHDSLLSRLYDRDYFQKSGAATTIGYGDYTSDANRAELMALAEERLSIASRYWEAIPPRTLEIGCATGEFCASLAAKGSQPVGVDAASFAIEEARRRYPGLDLRVGAIENAVSPDERFGAVFAFETFEHVPSPRAFLRRVHACLESEGLFVLTTPNVDAAEGSGPGGWRGFQASLEHLYFFGQDSIERLAGQEGFTMLAWLTGGGRGRARPPVGRRILNRALTATRLFAAVQRWRNRLSRRTAVMGCRPGGRGHNLLCVLRATKRG